MLYMQIRSPRILLRTRERAAAAGGMPHMGRGATPIQTSPQVFEHFLAPGNPRENGAGCLMHMQDEGE